ncbi:DUF4349 domain-containing protein [Frigoriflavimonas asaccharolytica]|uniref:DUF4349 domain-containing protein n=1 Tax=Frigoriflavimonas asaccharolytica TaxID=2735899 RepID=A0A8J8KBD4_9FLAO|nr:DUF4349 domain-containing protein [Frigoriflavimonas asaccharolytica]NRS92464.1 hypothetical protein [Frigoriflavimonas asaccharolytica]
MKKIVLTLITVFSLIACQKSEVDAAKNAVENSEIAENLSTMSADSVSSSLDNLPKLTKEQTDAALATIKGTAEGKIAELKEEKELLTEKVAKELDSATRKTIVSEIKIAQQKIDSVKNSIATKVNTKSTAPKIIRETKVVYRETPRAEKQEAAPRIVKNGQLEILVEDVSLAKDATKEQIEKYDGIIKNEKNSSYNDEEYTYLKVAVPLEKSEYLIQDLENYVGKIVSRNVEITGQDYAKNSICNLEITLANNTENASVATTPTSFGGRTLGAVGSGWNVIQEIFLFILPFWPVFLIGGIVYYFVKKKKAEKV